jgi:hypothetical protein
MLIQKMAVVFSTGGVSRCGCFGVGENGHNKLPEEGGKPTFIKRENKIQGGV